MATGGSPRSARCPRSDNQVRDGVEHAASDRCDGQLREPSLDQGRLAAQRSISPNPGLARRCAGSGVCLRNPAAPNSESWLDGSLACERIRWSANAPRGGPADACDVANAIPGRVGAGAGVVVTRPARRRSNLLAAERLRSVRPDRRCGSALRPRRYAATAACAERSQTWSRCRADARIRRCGNKPPHADWL
jgi:hypothetical protein